MSELPALPRTERWLLGAAVCALAIFAWVYLGYETQRMNVSGVSECMRMKMSGPENWSWPLGALLSLFLMWAIMMVAMMLPSALPMILTFGAVARDRERKGRPYVPLAIFVLGYVLIWLGFSVIAAIAQWVLHRQAMLSASMVITSAWLGGGLLLGGGIFQFTPLKNRCLSRCRGPLEFILTRWREGWGGALRMGLEHGIFCAGCCWALMALLFVSGVMNILWVAALTIFVCLEKALPARIQVSRLVGLILVGWGMFVLLRS